MDKETIKLSKDFAKKLQKSINPDKVILFGSRARGDNFKTSDFDFIIVSDNFKNINFLKRISKMYDFWDNNYDIEAICYTNKELEKKEKETGIVKKALKEGINILEII